MCTCDVLIRSLLPTTIWHHITTKVATCSNQPTVPNGPFDQTTRRNRTLLLSSWMLSGSEPLGSPMVVTWRLRREKGNENKQATNQNKEKHKVTKQSQKKNNNPILFPKKWFLPKLLSFSFPLFGLFFPSLRGTTSRTRWSRSSSCFCRATSSSSTRSASSGTPVGVRWVF